MPRKAKQAKYDRPIKVALTCNNSGNIEIDSSVIGYGCTLETAKNDFFAKLLAKAADTLRCGQGGCEGQSQCVAECTETPAIEQNLKSNRVQMAGCPQGVGWKSFLHEGNETSQRKFRCTCIPRAI